MREQKNAQKLAQKEVVKAEKAGQKARTEMESRAKAIDTKTESALANLGGALAHPNISKAPACLIERANKFKKELNAVYSNAVLVGQKKDVNLQYKMKEDLCIDIYIYMPSANSCFVVLQFVYIYRLILSGFRYKL